MDGLSKLFGGPTRTKIARLFVLNPDLALAVPEIVNRTKTTTRSARRELSVLTSAGLLVRSKKDLWRANPEFPLRRHFQTLFKADLVNRQHDLTSRFSRAGKVKLLLIAGTFIQAEDSRVDLVIVGDKLKKRVIEQAVSTLEADIGRELTYALFTTTDFLYRVNACDKFIRDILDYPHERLIDRLST